MLRSQSVSQSATLLQYLALSSTHARTLRGLVVMLDNVDGRFDDADESDGDDEGPLLPYAPGKDPDGDLPLPDIAPPASSSSSKNPFAELFADDDLEEEAEGAASHESLNVGACIIEEEEEVAVAAAVGGVGAWPPYWRDRKARPLTRCPPPCCPHSREPSSQLSSDIVEPASAPAVVVAVVVALKRWILRLLALWTHYGPPPPPLPLPLPLLF